MGLLRKTIVVGPFQCNCSIIADPVSKEAALIDAGDDFEMIRRELLQGPFGAFNVKWSFHTHAHLDHIGAVSDLKRHLPETKIILHRDDAWLYENLQMQGQMFGLQYATPPTPDFFFEEGFEFSLGEHKLQTIHTPGHSPGGTCLRCNSLSSASYTEASETSGASGSPFLFSGDTLFHESVGRTDLWGADAKLLEQSIKTKLFTLDESTTVLPGHGPLTSIGHEIRNNPFVGHGA